MARNYYHLIASLPEFVPKTDFAGNTGLLQIRDFILETVSDGDAAHVRELLGCIDNYNLLTLTFGKNRAWKQGGKYIPESTPAHEIKHLDLPGYMRDFFDALEQHEAETGEKLDEFAAERSLYDRYHREMKASKNSFVSKWNEFEREIRNIQTAHICRKANVPIENQLILEDELTDALTKSNAADFGLSKERDHLAQLIQIFEIQDMLEREKKLDLFRWNGIDEINTFEYFTLNAALGILQKACIIDRWAALDDAAGEKTFRKLVMELKSWKS